MQNCVANKTKYEQNFENDEYEWNKNHKYIVLRQFCGNDGAKNI